MNVVDTLLIGVWVVIGTERALLVDLSYVSAGVLLELAQLVTIVGAAALRAGSLRFGWRTPTAYDVWSDLEARFAAGSIRSSRG